MTDIKFCGLSRAVDAAFAASLGVRYVGCIFAGGPRHQTPEGAAAVLAGLGPAPGQRRVGVFANATPGEVASAARVAGLDVVQLHDDPTVARLAVVRAATGGEIWAVVRCAGADLPPRLDALWEAADAVLLDARAPGQLGGTGQTLPWRALAAALEASRARAARSGRLVLAGGLTPENVGEAIAALRPDVVDTSSGVECAPGVKDHRRMAAFVQAVAAADRISDPWPTLPRSTS